MLTLAAPKAPLAEDQAQFFSAYGDYSRWIETIDLVSYDSHIDENTHAVVPLMGMHCGYNPWRALPKLGLDPNDVDLLMQESANVCPITNQPYNALLPRGIHFLSPEDPEIAALVPPEASFLLRPGNAHLAFPCYGRGHGNGGLSLNDIQRVLLGSGYTDVMLPYDGQSEIVSVRIPLVLAGTEPVAYLLCAARLWLNK